MNAPIFIAPTRLCVVRHGETAWNAERRIQGQTDIPLNATGHRQALAAARGLARHAFAALYTSDLQRARDTAAAASQLLQLPMISLPALRERHYGSFQGSTPAEAQAADPTGYARYAARDPNFDFNGGETLATFAQRIVTATTELAARHPGETILVVAHGGVLDILYRHATARPLSTPRDFPIPNAAMNWLTLGADGWTIDSWGEQGHLAQSLELVAE